MLLPTSNVKSYTDAHKPVSKSDNKVTFGKYDLIKPFTLEQLRVHFENNKPFRKVSELPTVGPTAWAPKGNVRSGGQEACHWANARIARRR